jgi:hypothetical protein
MGHDRGYGIDSANGPHSAWRWGRVQHPLGVWASLGRTEPGNYRDEHSWVLINKGAGYLLVPILILQDHLRGSSCTLYHLSFSHRTLISSRKAILSDSSKVIPDTGLIVQNNYFSDPHGQAKHSPQ